MALSIDKNRCPQNHACPIIRVCPVGAITQNGYALPAIDAAKCTECSKCVRYCGMQAVYKTSKLT